MAEPAAGGLAPAGTQRAFLARFRGRIAVFVEDRRSGGEGGALLVRGERVPEPFARGDELRVAALGGKIGPHVAMARSRSTPSPFHSIWLIIACEVLSACRGAAERRHQVVKAPALVGTHADCGPVQAGMGGRKPSRWVKDGSSSAAEADAAAWASSSTSRLARTVDGMAGGVGERLRLATCRRDRGPSIPAARDPAGSPGD